MSIVLFLFQSLPAILQGIYAVNAALGSGNGATKKQIILNAITAGAQAGESIPESHVQAVSTLIDSTVAALNKSGLLDGKKSK